MHNRKPNRLKGYDYSRPGNYFVTISVRSRFANNNTFGNIKNGQIILNDIGLIVKKQWIWIPEQYHHISHDEWIIMPDHMHGIITIKQMDNGVYNKTGRDRSRPVPTGANTNIAETIDIGATTTCIDNVSNAIIDTIPKIKPLDQIIGAFKTTSSKLIHQSGNTLFAWQRSYYDHIIRDKESLYHIRNYIINNPINFKNIDAFDGNIGDIINRNDDTDGDIDTVETKFCIVTHEHR